MALRPFTDPNLAISASSPEADSLLRSEADWHMTMPSSKAKATLNQLTKSLGLGRRFPSMSSSIAEIAGRDDIAYAVLTTFAFRNEMLGRAL